MAAHGGTQHAPTFCENFKVRRFPMRVSRPASLFVWILLLAPSLAGRQAPRDPQAVALAVSALAALTGGAPVNDVALTGAATQIAGSTRETGTVTLKAKGTQESRIDLALSNGRHTQIRNQAPGYPRGAWSGPDAISHPIALHNCWTDAVQGKEPLRGSRERPLLSSVLQVACADDHTGEVQETTINLFKRFGSFRLPLPATHRCQAADASR